MAGTGVLMFFEWDHGLTTVVHQWFSWIFLIGACSHLAINIRPLKNHFNSPLGRAGIVFFSCALLVSCFSWGRITGPQLKRPIEQALVDAPLWALAGVVHAEPDALLARLQKRGIHATFEKSIHELSVQNRIGENQLLAITFLCE